MKLLSLIIAVIILVCQWLSGCVPTPPYNGDKPPTENTENNEESNEMNTSKKMLVVYFSCTGNTENVAKIISDELDCDIFKIEAADPYTQEDLAYYTDCRADREQNDPTARPKISNSVSNMSDYDVVFIGYPIWHGQAPRIISTFIESYDFSDKTIVPFCTSHSSPLGSSATNLQRLAKDADWESGKCFTASWKKEDVTSWIDSMDLISKPQEAKTC